jgi:hypothetical protein
MNQGIAVDKLKGEKRISLGREGCGRVLKVGIWNVEGLRPN